ncbi:MAG: TPM domain-containing protein [Paludibacteraceae bacterium]|nr:TPM domain-containing protein [Paludibacteraceae bacterium]
MKRLNLLFAFSLLAVLVQAMVYTPTSLPNPKVQDRGNYVCNPDEIVVSSDVVLLNRLARQLEDSTQVELCVVAVNSIGEMEAFDFCYEVFQRWGIGKEGKNTGVLLFLAVESRDVRIMTGGGIEGVMTDAVCHSIVQETMMQPLRNADYSDAMALGALRIYEVCTDGAAPEELRQMTSATNRYHYTDESEENVWMELFYFVGVPCIIFALIILLLLLPKKCPKCGKRSLRKTSEQIINRATTRKEGLGVRSYCCKHCGHQEQKTYIIPKEIPTVVLGGGTSRGGFGGGSFGGGFGGGSTFGGGAGGKF